MTDIVDTATRSRMMAGIGGRDTRPELRLRKALHALGHRYRLHVKELPGRPDIVLPGHRVAIFVHGCFWHRHRGCRYATCPATRPDFWRQKFEANVRRDASNVKDLLGSGWRVAVVWECSLRKSEKVTEVAAEISGWIRGERVFLEVGEPCEPSGKRE